MPRLGLDVSIFFRFSQLFRQNRWRKQHDTQKNEDPGN